MNAIKQYTKEKRCLVCDHSLHCRIRMDALAERDDYMELVTLTAKDLDCNNFKEKK